MEWIKTLVFVISCIALSLQLPSDCVHTKCTHAKQAFKDLSDKLMSGKFNLTEARRVRKELKDVCPTPVCELNTKSVVGLALVTSHDDDVQALSMHKQVLNAFVKQTTAALKQEKTLGRTNVGQISIEAHLYLVIKSLENVSKQLAVVLRKFERCKCKNSHKSPSKVKSYETLTKTYSHDQSLYVLLKQVENFRYTMERDLLVRREKYIDFKCIDVDG